jgi:hypothetical protein
LALEFAGTVSCRLAGGNAAVSVAQFAITTVEIGLTLDTLVLGEVAHRGVTIALCETVHTSRRAIVANSAAIAVVVFLALDAATCHRFAERCVRNSLTGSGLALLGFVAGRAWTRWELFVGLIRCSHQGTDAVPRRLPAVDWQVFRSELQAAGLPFVPRGVGQFDNDEPQVENRPIGTRVLVPGGRGGFDVLEASS